MGYFGDVKKMLHAPRSAFLPPSMTPPPSEEGGGLLALNTRYCPKSVVQFVQDG